jgi:putative FmdB family regulatory protein
MLFPIAARDSCCRTPAVLAPRQPASLEFSYPPEVLMPVYEYLCEVCHKTFEKILTIAEHEKEEIKCPHCGSKKVVQEASAFFAVTGKKS